MCSHLSSSCTVCSQEEISDDSTILGNFPTSWEALRREDPILAQTMIRSKAHLQGPKEEAQERAKGGNINDEIDNFSTLHPEDMEASPQQAQPQELVNALIMHCTCTLDAHTLSHLTCCAYFHAFCLNRLLTLLSCLCVLVYTLLTLCLELLICFCTNLLLIKFVAILCMVCVCFFFVDVSKFHTWKRTCH